MLVLASVMLWTASPKVTQAETAGAVIEPAASCFVSPPEGMVSDIVRTCGHLVVPENPVAPTGRKVRIGYLRLGLPGRTAAKPPLFMLAGGPGDTFLAPTIFSLFDPALLGGVLTNRDVIVLEPRGGVESNPRLGCPAVAAQELQAVLDQVPKDQFSRLEAEAYSACAKTFKDQGVDLAQYNSITLAADIDLAREAFGFERIAIYGASYGTMLAQHYLKAFPDRVEAVVLDGADPLSTPSWTRGRAVFADNALQKLDMLCSAEATCGAAYDISAMVQTGIDLFDQGPLRASYSDPADPGRSVSFDISAEDFAQVVFGQMTGPIEIATLPAILQQATTDGRASMIGLMASLFGPVLLAPPPAGPDRSTNLMHLAVVCSEDPPSGPGDLDLPAGISDFARLIGQGVVRQYATDCAAIAVPVLPVGTDENASSALPILVLAGGLDVKTPTANVRVLEATLPNLQIVEFPTGSHVQIGEINLCAASIMVSFLDAPESPVATDCVAKISPLGFVLPDGRMSTE